MPLIWIEDAHSCKDTDALESMSAQFLNANFSVLHTISEPTGLEKLQNGMYALPFAFSICFKVCGQCRDTDLDWRVPFFQE